jgi:hypothetical protein
LHLKRRTVTKPILEGYQRFLFHYRKRDGTPARVLLAGGEARGRTAILPVARPTERHPLESGIRSFTREGTVHADAAELLAALDAEQAEEAERSGDVSSFDEEPATE